jgi:hypothetical protein
MKEMNGIPEGIIIATYIKGKFTWNCRKSNGFYCVTFNVRQTNRTFYSKDMDEMNNYIKGILEDGAVRVR